VIMMVLSGNSTKRMSPYRGGCMRKHADVLCVAARPPRCGLFHVWSTVEANGGSVSGLWETGAVHTRCQPACISEGPEKMLGYGTGLTSMNRKAKRIYSGSPNPWTTIPVLLP